MTYTGLDGVRYLRTITKRLATSTQMSTLFRNADPEPIIMYLCREYTLQSLARSPKRGEALSKSICDFLFAYRIHVGADLHVNLVQAALGSPTGQLILPESLKTIPVLITALLKHRTFSTVGGSTDEKVAAVFQLLTCGPTLLSYMLYPRVYPIYRCHVKVDKEDLSEVGLPSHVEGMITLPKSIPASGERLTTDGIFLLDNGTEFLVYIGEHVSRQYFDELVPGYIGVTSSALPYGLPAWETGKYMRSRSSLYLTYIFTIDRIWNVVTQLRMQKIGVATQSVRVIPAGSLEETYFMWNLVEDRLGSEKSYIDYLCGVRPIEHPLS